MKKIERALISTYDKTDLLDLANTLVNCGVEILSTGGTARHLRDAGIEIVDVSDYTGFPEMLEGRVKTLHPKIHGGLLAQWDNSTHVDQAHANGIKPIDIVICNLYPFEATIAKPDVTLEEAIENIGYWWTDDDSRCCKKLQSCCSAYRSNTICRHCLRIE